MRRLIAGIAIAAMAFALSEIASADTTKVATGTGFFVTSDGYFVTNFHVIANSDSLSIRTPRGDVLDASVAAVDQANDIAVLKASGAFPSLPIRPSTEVRRGTEVLTIGFPQIALQGLEAKVTQGIVSSLSGARNDPRFFQISVPVQPGNSGGPLIARDGSVVGIVTAKLDAMRTLEGTGSLPENVNYALKSNYLIETLNALAQRTAIALPKPTAPAVRHDWVSVTQAAEKSVGIVIAYGNAATGPSSPSSAKAAPPPPRSREPSIDAAPAEAIAATVNGMPVPQRLVDHFVASFVEQGRPNTSELRRAVIDELIARELFVREAMRRPLHAQLQPKLEQAREAILIRAVRHELEDSDRSRTDLSMDELRHALRKSATVEIAAEGEMGPVIATANGRPIFRENFNDSVARLIAAGTSATPEQRQSALNALIENTLIAEEAEKRGLHRRPRVHTELDVARHELLIRALITDHLRLAGITEQDGEQARQSVQELAREMRSNARIQVY